MNVIKRLQIHTGWAKIGCFVSNWCSLIPYDQPIKFLYFRNFPLKWHGFWTCLTIWKRLRYSHKKSIPIPLERKNAKFIDRFGNNMFKFTRRHLQHATKSLIIVRFGRIWSLFVVNSLQNFDNSTVHNNGRKNRRYFNTHVPSPISSGICRNTAQRSMGSLFLAMTRLCIESMIGRAPYQIAIISSP